MATVSKAMADDLIAGNGRMTKDQEDAPDNPWCIRIVEYTDQGGSLAYGTVFEHDRNPLRYEQETEFVRNPRLVWQRANGFSLVELLICVVIIGILAAICIPNFIAMQDRAREASTKANMHCMQLIAEDFAVGADGIYPSSAREAMGMAPSIGGSAMDLVDPEGARPFPANPFSREMGEDVAWENRENATQDPSPIPGIVSYGAFAGDYAIRGRGRHAALSLVLTNGGQQ